MEPENANEQPEFSETTPADDNVDGIIEIEFYASIGSLQAGDVTGDAVEAVAEVEPVGDLATLEPIDGVVEIETYNPSEIPAEPVANDVPETPAEPVTDSMPETPVADTIEQANDYDSMAVSGTGNYVSQTYTTPVSNMTNEANTMQNQNPVTPAGADGSGVTLDDWVVMPDTAWPPPIFMKRNAPAKERFYLEYRWHSQWKYYDSKASQSKNTYYYLQRIVVIGSLIIPALISLNSTIARFINELANGDAATENIIRIGVDAVTVIISLAVAGAASLETLYKYGENWNSYRSAAEELQAEKNFYDMGAGPYANNPNPFGTFVERVEGIVANQNGKFFQSVQAQIAKQEEDNEEIVASFKAGDDDEYEFRVSQSPQTTTADESIPG